jgi:type IV secretory pathway TraG/TraD family ATPase VirD4
VSQSQESFGPSPVTAETRAKAHVTVLEGIGVQPTPSVAGAQFDAARPMRAVIQGPAGAIRFDDDLLSKHVLFLGSIGTGKTNAMMQLVHALRASATAEDVFVVFDSKADFLRHFYQEGDAVISNQPGASRGGVVWNLFSDVLLTPPDERGDEVFEIASTVFSEHLSRSAQNYFFAAGAQDIFAAVVEAMARGDAGHTNADLRAQLEASSKELWDYLRSYPDLAGSARYLDGKGNTPESVRAFLQQTVNSAFSGAFRMPGSFSVRNFVRARSARALFIEYDIAVGGRLLPVFRVLMDMAIKEALGLGRSGIGGNVFFVMDEFALLPQLSHISDGINFGRSFGLKFAVGTQNVDQVLHAYGPEMGRTILSGFGTLFAFRLMDEESRALVRQRFGTNRKQITTEMAVRSQGVRQEVIIGNVIEDWFLSSLTVGDSIVSLPEGPPFFFPFGEFDPER